MSKTASHDPATIRDGDRVFKFTASTIEASNARDRSSRERISLAAHAACLNHFLSMHDMTPAEFNDDHWRVMFRLLYADDRSMMHSLKEILPYDVAGREIAIARSVMVIPPGLGIPHNGQVEFFKDCMSFVIREFREYHEITIEESHMCYWETHYSSVYPDFESVIQRAVDARS